MKKLTIKEFIERSDNIHGRIYDYSNVIYEKSNRKVEIKCQIHGVFVQKPHNHMIGQGCPHCGKVKKAINKTRSLESYIAKFKEVHNNKYDYSKLVYNGYHKKSEIICPIHGSFSQILSQHLRGTGCPGCKYDKFSENYSKNPTGWTLTQWKIAASKSKRFDGFKVYIIKCWNENEEFYKIGRTYLSVKYRFSGNMPYDYTIIEQFTGDADKIFKLENKLKKRNKKFKYVPKIEFGGMYECFSKIKINKK